jgi:hypothetical protein
MGKIGKAEAVEEYKPKTMMHVEDGGDTVKGIDVGDNVTLSVSAKLVGEDITDYDGKKRHTQRFEILGISKAGKNAKQNAKLQE